jgi:hypothetical protein
VFLVAADVLRTFGDFNRVRAPMQGTHPVQSAILAIHGSFPDAPGVRSADDYCLSGNVSSPLALRIGSRSEASRRNSFPQLGQNRTTHSVGSNTGSCPEGSLHTGTKSQQFGQRPTRYITGTYILATEEAQRRTGHRRAEVRRPAEEDAGSDPVTNVDIVASRRRKPNKSGEQRPRTSYRVPSRRGCGAGASRAHPCFPGKAQCARP